MAFSNMIARMEKGNICLSDQICPSVVDESEGESCDHERCISNESCDRESHLSRHWTYLYEKHTSSIVVVLVYYCKLA